MGLFPAKKERGGRELGILSPGLLPTKQQASGLSPMTHEAHRARKPICHRIKSGGPEGGRERNHVDADSEGNVSCASPVAGTPAPHMPTC